MLPYVYLHRHCIDSKTSSHPAVCGMPASAFETAYWMAKYSLVDIATLALHLYQTSLHAFLMAYTCRKDPIMRHAHRHMIMVACTSYCPISKLLKLLAAPYTKHVDGKESDRPFRCSIGFRENPSLLACQKTVPEAVVYTRVILLSFNTFQTNPNGVCWSRLVSWQTNTSSSSFLNDTLENKYHYCSLQYPFHFQTCQIPWYPW